ncbi:MAG: PAS domain S-box protein [Chloroflexi bacterium]|nr:PAS domain S-box protein [Chloroflexota bacterium]
MKQIIRPPTFADEEKTRAATLIHIVSWVYVLLGLVLIVLLLVLNPERSIRALLIGGSCVLVLGLQVVSRRGNVRLASWLLAYGLWGLTMFSLVTGGGSRTSGFSIFLPVLLGAFLLGRNGGMAITVLTIVMGFTLTYVGENTDWLVEPEEYSPYSFWVSQSLVLVVAALLITLANSQMKRAVARALQAEGSWRSLVENTPDLIMELDRSGCLRLINHLPPGMTPDDVVGQSVYELAPPVCHDWLRTAIPTAFDAGQVQDHECELADGEGQWRQGRLHPIVEGDKVIALQLIIRDITLQKQAERQRFELALQREKLEVQQTFISNVTHDLKNPLATIRLNLHLLERLPDEDAQLDQIQRTRAQVQRLENLIQNLLTISRLDYLPQLELSPIAPAQFLAGIADQFQASAADKGLMLAVESAPDVPSVIGDKDELERAITNLVENAVNYASEGQSVTLRAYQQAANVVFEVSDTGPGIEEPELDQIFDRFYRGEGARVAVKGGSGLGLAIVKKVAEMHGGQVWVDSVVGQGSSFRIQLPLASE